MADSDGGSPRTKHNKTVNRDLPDDLILEVVARLPLKRAAQCSILNRNIRRCIARPEFWRRHAASSPRAANIFHCSVTNPKVFTRFCDGISSQSTVTLDRETSIIASCNGILLICDKSAWTYSVFNPITDQVWPIDFPANVSSSVALAVDRDDADSLFKVVTADVMTEPDRTLVTFSVLVPGSGPPMSLKSQDVLLIRRRLTLDALRPVYAAGTLYWLGDDAKVTLTFDLTSQRGSVTEGPVIGENRTGDKWLGCAAGSARFVHSLREEIVIYGHDRLKREWRVEHRIKNMSSPSNNDYKYGQCMHFDGGRLFFLLWRAGKEGHVYVYDLSRGAWEESEWTVRSWADRHQHFFSIVPTNAKVCKANSRLELDLKVNEAVLFGLRILLKPTAE